MPKDTLRPHSTNDLHIASHMLRKPALSNVLYPVPRFTPRCVLSESRVLLSVGLASEGNIRKNSLTIQNRPSAQSSRPTFFFFVFFAQSSRSTEGESYTAQ